MQNTIICEPRSFKLAFRNDAAVNIREINDEILDSVDKYAIKAVLGYTQKGRAVTLEELARNGITDDLPDEGEVVKVLTFEFEEDKLFVLDKQSAVPLARLKLTVSYRRGPGAEAAEEGPGKPLREEDDYTADVFVAVKEAT